MKISIVFAIACFCSASTTAFAQTNTVTSGDWTDGSVWSGGTQPAASATVNVNHPLTINTNLSPTGVWTFNSNTTDQPGGTAYTFNPTAGTNTITIASGATVTFEGGSSGTPNQFNSGTIDIYGTLILGYTDLNNSGNLNVNIRAGGTLIVYGNLTNKNNSGTFAVNGALIVYGDFNNSTGSVTVSGSGTIDTTGKIFSNGGSTVFGTTNDCNQGPCSGTALLCSHLNYISNPANTTNKTICSGLTAGTITANGTGTSPTYQWISSTDGTTYSNASGTSTNQSYVTPTLTQDTWYKVRKTVSGCTSTSAALKVTVLTGGGWIGTTNNWGTASNWCNNTVPTSSTDVVISNATGIANMPTIASGTSAVCRNLTINNTFPGSAVTLASAADASLSIFGNFTNNGSFTDNSTSASAGVKFVGTSAQTISGTTANVFTNLTINNTSGVVPAVNITTNNINVQSNLTMTAGTVNLNGFTATLGTSTSSTGTLSYSTGTRFYGGNIQRWYPTTAVAVGSGLFPIGSSSDYRPIYFGSSSALTSGGTIKVSHTASTGTTSITPFTDNGGSVSIRSNSFWTVTTANGISGTHNMRTEGTGFGTVGDVAHLRMTLASAISPGTDGAHAGSLTNPQVNRTGVTTANLSNNFYWGSINPVITPLPVELLFFIGTNPENGSIKLDWATAQEKDFLKFEIERSPNGKEFSKIGEVNGFGQNTKERNDYSFIDSNPLMGKNYYRLRRVDIDGFFEFSNVVYLHIDPSEISKNFNTVVIFPNPVDEQLIHVRTNFEPTITDKIIIIDNLGQIKKEYAPASLESEIPLNLNEGSYLMRYITSNRTYTLRFVIVQ